MTLPPFVQVLVPGPLREFLRVSPARKGFGPDSEMEDDDEDDGDGEMDEEDDWEGRHHPCCQCHECLEEEEEEGRRRRRRRTWRRLF